MSNRTTWERDLPQTGEVWSDDEADPSRFFGEAGRLRLTVVLAPGRVGEDVSHARAALQRATAVSAYKDIDV